MQRQHSAESKNLESVVKVALKEWTNSPIGNISALNIKFLSCNFVSITAMQFSYTSSLYVCLIITLANF